MKLSDEQIQTIVTQVERMLRSERVEVRWSRGIKWQDNYSTGYREAEPTDGVTVEILVNGGARDVEDTWEDKLKRFLAEHGNRHRGPS